MVQSSNCSRPRLCNSCQRFWEQPFEQLNPILTRGAVAFDEYELWYVRGPTRASEDLVASIEAGCPLCFLYWKTSFGLHEGQSLDNLRRGDIVNHTLEYYLEWDKNLLKFQAMGLHFRTIYAKHIRLTADFAVAFGEQVSPISDNTASEGCWKFISEKLRVCTTTHKACSIYSKGGNWRPTRLVNISNPENVHLVDHSSITHQSISYITLSHRWTKGIPRLTNANIASWLKRIPLCDLTQVFRDAITVAKRLNCHYLWIDSLCIIQDSEEDWKKESALMGEVYRRCLCTISATAASDGSSSLFAPRNPACIFPFRLDISRHGHRTPYLCTLFDIWDESITNAPLNKRGWVIQERLLSPITISFGKQIFWECHELEACETWPNGRLVESKFNSVWQNTLCRNALVPKTWLQDICKPCPDLDEPYRVWKSIVRSYTATSLTKEEDRLVALSGLAQQIQRGLSDSYCAGLWRKDILSQLLWYSGRKCAKQPTRYRAPSWSWASIEGSVFFPRISRPGPELCRLLEVHVRPKTDDLTGQVVGGHLKISTLLCRLPEKSIKASGSTFTPAGVRNEFRSDTSAQSIDEWDIFQGPFYAVPIMVIENCFFQNRRVLMALVVRQVSLAAQEYKRVGLLTLRVKETLPDVDKADICLHQNPVVIPVDKYNGPKEYEFFGVRWEDGAWRLRNGEPCCQEATITLI